MARKNIYEEWTINQLKTFAEKNGISLRGKKRKKDLIIQTIDAHFKKLKKQDYKKFKECFAAPEEIAKTIGCSLEEVSTKLNNHQQRWLFSKTYKELKKLAKTDDIQLWKAESLRDIANVMAAYYLREENQNPAITDSEAFVIRKDAENNVNVSVWFRKNARKLEEHMKSPHFKKVVFKYASNIGKKPYEFFVCRSTNGELYLPHFLATILALEVSTDLYLALTAGNSAPDGPKES